MGVKNAQFMELNSTMSNEQYPSSIDFMSDEEQVHQTELDSMFTEMQSMNVNKNITSPHPINNKPQRYLKNNTTETINDSNGFSSLSALISITIIVSIMTIFMAVSIIMLK